MKSLFLTLLLSSLALTAVANEGDLRTIPALDVPRYMGTWYEIAKYPNRFQKKCVKDTRAVYELLANGTVKVTNRCTTESGEVDVALGSARQVGEARSPKLEVRFAPEWLSFIPWVWGNYWVIDLDPEYQLVAVSEPKLEYLWVLARTPTVNPRAYEELVARLVKKGFDSRKIVLSPQQN